jgi:hypothetical protein
MKRKIVLSSIVIFAIGVVGCGKSDVKKVDNSKVFTQAPVSIPVNHIGEVERMIHADFTLPNFDENMKLDNGENFFIAEDKDSYYMSVKHKDIAKNIQFYIDADNNSKTGNIEEGGAEFLVENGQLYSLDTHAVWKKYADGSVSSYNAGTTIDTIKLSKRLLTKPFFGAKAQVLDNTWIPKFSSPKLDTFPKTYYKINDLTSFENFKKISPYISNEDKKATMFLDKNSNKIDILLSSEKFEDKVQVYIDSDNNKDTGLQPKLKTEDGKDVNMWINMGADYLITENSQLFRWNLQKKDWIYVEDIPYLLLSEENKKSMIMHLSKSSLKNITENIKLSVVTYDSTNKKDWKIKYAMPKLNNTTGIPSYNLK